MTEEDDRYHEDRQRRGADRRELPVHAYDDDHGADDHDRVGDQGVGTVHHHVLDRVHIVGQARHDVTGASGLKEVERLAQQMAIGIEAHVKHEALPELVHDIHADGLEERHDCEVPSSVQPSRGGSVMSPIMTPLNRLSTCGQASAAAGEHADRARWLGQHGPETARSATMRLSVIAVGLFLVRRGSVHRRHGPSASVRHQPSRSCNHRTDRIARPLGYHREHLPPLRRCGLYGDSRLLTSAFVATANHRADGCPLFSFVGGDACT